jgi:hypothetical protein
MVLVISKPSPLTENLLAPAIATPINIERIKTDEVNADLWYSEQLNH